MKIWHLHQLRTQQGEQHLALDKFGWKDNTENEKCCWEHRHIPQHPAGCGRIGSYPAPLLQTEGKQSPLDTYHPMEEMLGLCSEILGNATCATLPTKRQDGGQGGVPDFRLKSSGCYQLSWLWNLIFSFEMTEDEPLFLNLVQEELKKGGLETSGSGPRAMTRRAVRSDPRT